MSEKNDLPQKMKISRTESGVYKTDVISAPIAGWLDLLWEAVCLRAARPISGVLLDSAGIQTIAKETFENFLASGGTPEANLQAMLTVLTRPVQQRSLEYVAAKRQEDPEAFRDLTKAKWLKNPPLPDLLTRSSEGQLTSPDWNIAEPVLWQRASPIYHRLHINENEARDVYAETVGDFLKARPAAECPMRKMLVFEELPRLFGVIAERRAISWVRKQTTLKMKPNRSGLSIDDPDTGLNAKLQEPRSLNQKNPLARASFDDIRNACQDHLDEFEWHLLETLFSEGTQTREELSQDDWTLTQLGLESSSSRSTRLRRLNTAIADALATLGRALEEADL